MPQQLKLAGKLALGHPELQVRWSWQALLFTPA